MKLDSASATHIGRRKNNEDSCCADAEVGLFAVADGMGGYEGGEVASSLAVETLDAFVRRHALDDEATWPFKPPRENTLAENVLSLGVQLAHRVVCDHKTPELAMMGSTLCALLLDANMATVAHVGDSRVYRVRRGRLEQLTRDHSYYADLVAAGNRDLGPRDQHPYGSIITRALGTDRANPDVTSLPLLDGDVFLLSSDGLHEPVGDAFMLETLRSCTAAQACTRLVEEAYARGGRDNITAVVVRFLGLQAGSSSSTIVP
jgi:serine/threonine protein phosphatase PrpC